MVISKVPINPNPKVSLEQYTIPPEVAAEILYIAGYVNDDLIGKKVLDLGCGTGRLAIGAAYLGASEVTGIDIDREAVEIAKIASKELGLNGVTEWVAGDLYAIRGDYHTVVQNPPFGVQRKGADRLFIKRALELGNRVYSLHKDVDRERDLIKKLSRTRGLVTPVSPSRFLERFIEKNGGEVEVVYAMLMRIPHLFTFHRKFKHEFIVDLYIIRRKNKPT
ncbi:MAG: METTL5 family protein [Candidatus Bathyarchaeia archaeon]